MIITILAYGALAIAAFAVMHLLDADEVAQICYPVVLVLTVIACRM